MIEDKPPCPIHGVRFMGRIKASNKQQLAFECKMCRGRYRVFLKKNDGVIIQ